MKRIVGLMLFVLACCVLVACGEDDETHRQDNNVQSNGENVSQTTNEPNDETPTNTPTPTTAPASIQTILYEYTDDSGYQIEIEMQISPWICWSTKKDLVYSTWNTMGRSNDGARFYEPDQFNKVSGLPQGNQDCYYAIGTLTVRNRTRGDMFKVTESNPRKECVDFTTGLGIGIAYPLRDQTGMHIGNLTPVSLVIYYSGSPQYQGAAMQIKPDMRSDTWGPVKFLLFCREVYTPNNPDGFVAEFLKSTPVSIYSEWDSQYQQHEKEIIMEIIK